MLPVRAFDRTFDNLLDEIFWTGNRRYRFGGVESTENENNINFTIEAPGLSKSDFEITLKEGYMYVKAGDQSRNSYRSFSHEFLIPREANVDQINATYEAGLLKITIPVTEHHTITRKIEVK